MAELSYESVMKKIEHVRGLLSPNSTLKTLDPLDKLMELRYVLADEGVYGKLSLEKLKRMTFAVTQIDRLYSDHIPRRWSSHLKQVKRENDASV